MKQIAALGLMALLVACATFSCGGSREILIGGSGNDGGNADSGHDGGAADAGQVVCTLDCPAREMVDVPAGSFLMGCNKPMDTECRWPNEFPSHQVTVPAFKIDKNDVTIGDFQKCVTAGACAQHFDDYQCFVLPDPTGNAGVLPQDFRDTSKPVVCIDWNQAKTYCAWAGKRLPTEGEWEKAARGTDGRKYPWGNDSLDCDHAVMSANGCNNSCTAPVGSKPLGVSPYGILDMAGNVYQWVEDDWHDNYTGAPTDGSAWVDNPRGLYRVIRGGSWHNDRSDAFRASNRGFDHKAGPFNDLGFRCAASSP